MLLCRPRPGPGPDHNNTTRTAIPPEYTKKDDKLRRLVKKLGARYDRDEHAWFFKAGTPDTEAKLQKLKAAFEATAGTPKKRQVASNATASPAKKSRPAAGNQGKSGK